MPPALSPMMVTLSGSPPNAAILLLYPVERGDLVHVAVVAEFSVVRVLLRELRMCESAEAADAIVGAEHQHALLRQVRARIRWRRRATIHEATAVDPEDHRQLVRGTRWTPDIGIQAVFGRRCAERRCIARKRHLHAVVSVLRRIANSLPCCGRLRCTPAIGCQSVARQRECPSNSTRPRIRCRAVCRYRLQRPWQLLAPRSPLAVAITAASVAMTRCLMLISFSG